MRIGSNPEKGNEIEIYTYHRVVIPVYIPHFENYFATAFDVFKLCIQSLLATVHDKTRITIYNNNSHADVEKYINDIYKSSPAIDQVFHSKENVGKVNAILASVKGNHEPLITITDADVLFKEGWQEGTEEVFIGFPEAGMVSPVATSKAYNFYCANNWWYGFSKGKIFFDDVQDPEALERLDASLGRVNKLYAPIHLKKYLVLANKKRDCEAVMGCGHFVATLRREVFDKGSTEPAFFKLGGKVIAKFIDEPNERLGFLRLATKKNYAYHMGNKIEPWMHEEYDKLLGAETKVVSRYKHSSFPEPKSIPARPLFAKICKKLLSSRFKPFILRKLGLDHQGGY